MCGQMLAAAKATSGALMIPVAVAPAPRLGAPAPAKQSQPARAPQNTAPVRHETFQACRGAVRAGGG